MRLSFLRHIDALIRAERPHGLPARITTREDRVKCGWCDGRGQCTCQHCGGTGCGITVRRDDA